MAVQKCGTACGVKLKPARYEKRNDLGENVSKSVAIVGTRGYPSYYGGFETAVRTLAPYLADRGWDVTVYGRDQVGDGGDPRVRSVLTKGISTKSLSTLSHGFAASRHARRERPDIALVMNVANGYFLRSLKRAKIPTVVNVDGIEWKRAKWGRIAKSVFYRGARLTARHATSLVFDARAIERYWLREFGVAGKFIPYGADRPTSNAPLPDGLTSGGYALLVARFVPENSIADFIRAAKVVAETHDVVLVGSSGSGGTLEAEVAQLSEVAPRVRWMGHIADDSLLFSLWSNAGVYFHGHTVGGTNPALVQAMACGAPTVAVDTVFNREVLGTDGFYVEAGSSTLAEALLRVLDNPDLRSSLSRAARHEWSERYTWPLVCAAYEEVLDRAINA